MVYNAANSQQSNTYQYPTDKKLRKLFEVPTYLRTMIWTGTIWFRIGFSGERLLKW